MNVAEAPPTGVDAFGLFDPPVDGDAKRAGADAAGVDPFGVTMPDVRGRSGPDAWNATGVDAFAEFEPVDRWSSDAVLT